MNRERCMSAERWWCRYRLGNSGDRKMTGTGTWPIIDASAFRARFRTGPVIATGPCTGSCTRFMYRSPSRFDVLPPPDPRYLRLHAACAQAAHLSGAGEYINNILRDMETTRVLAKDGSSADLLNFRLFDASVF